MAKSVKSAIQISLPTSYVADYFTATTDTSEGVFSFEFKWLNDRWNCWVTMPDGTIREAGVYPNVVSWTGFLDYGLLFSTDLTNIGKDNLSLVEMYLLVWA